MRAEDKNEPEKMELRHEPVAGYRMAFYVVSTLAVAYLVVIFLYSL